MRSYLKHMRSKKLMAKHVFNAHFVGLRAVISVEVKRMKGLHHLLQDCTSSGRGTETKLSKFQQIDALNVKKRSRHDSCVKPMNSKGEKIGNMWFGGHKGISSGTL